MIPDLEPIYAKVGNAISDRLPNEWKVARVEVIYYPENVNYFGEFLHSDNRIGSFHLGYELICSIDDLRQKFRDAGQPVWGSVVFELHADGKFSCKWSYDNCDENGNRRWDADEWTRMQNERSERITM